MRWNAADLVGAAALVVGDIMLDEYWWGEASRISPEAPVPVVEVSRRSTVPGGAANAAAGVVALRGRALLAGVVGDDANGALLRTAAMNAGVQTDGIIVEAGRGTTTKSRLLAQGQHVVRVDVEHRAPPAPVTADHLAAYVQAALPGVDVVVLSDYGKGVVSPGLARTAIGLAAHHRKPVIVDPAGGDCAKYRGAAVVTPSVSELAAMVGRRVATDDDLLAAGAEASALLPGTDLLITRGAEGMWLMSASQIVLDIPTRARSVYDVTGAGDTVVATMAAALARRAPTRAAVVLANAAAGIAVGKPGTATVSLGELIREVPAELLRDTGRLLPFGSRDGGGGVQAQA